MKVKGFLVLKVASDLHPCDLTGDKTLFLQTSRTPPSGDLLRGLWKPQLLMLQNPHFDGTETNQPNKPVLVNEIIANWKDVVKALTDLYNKTHRGCELKNVFEGFISGVDEAPLPLMMRVSIASWRKSRRWCDAKGQTTNEGSQSSVSQWWELTTAMMWVLLVFHGFQEILSGKKNSFFSEAEDWISPW